MVRPRVTLKLATSLDGRIATASGESRWITGEAARAEVQKLRAAYDAVMVGAGTVRADDPELLARTDPPPARQPLRVVVASRFQIAPVGKLFATLDQAPLLVAGRIEAADAAAALHEAGAQILLVRSDTTGVDLTEALTMLASLRLESIGTAVNSVLAEGGGAIAASLLAAGLVDRIEWFRAPIVLGAEGVPAVAALNVARLADAPAYRRVAVQELGPDLWESYERV